MLNVLLAVALADALRTMYDTRDYAGAIDIGRAYVTAAPDDLELRAVYIHNLMQDDALKARAMADAMRAAHPESKWTWLAAAYTAEPGEVALAREIAAKLQGETSDEFVVARADMLDAANEHDAALKLVENGKSARLLVEKARLLRARRETEEQALAVYAEARKADPAFVGAWYEPGFLLKFMRRAEEAKPLLDEAARLAPYSVRLHMQDRASIERLLRERDQPMVLYWAMRASHDLGEEELACALEERLRREAPDSQWALYLIKGRDILDYPYRRDPDAINDAVRVVLTTGKNLTDDEVRSLAHRITRRPLAYAAMQAAAEKLADRKLDLEYAESLARQSGELLATDPDYINAESAYPRAVPHDTLGWVLLAQGRLAEAEKELTTAYALYPDVPHFALHLGKLYEAQGKLVRAEQVYREGVMVKSNGPNPNRPALEALFQKQHKTLKGFDTYFKRVTAKGTAGNKQKILAQRVKNPKTAPQFRLKTLQGKTVSLADLRGKLVVVNFWGVWCGWCVKEMPDLQKLASAYAHDPQVSVLTIDTDQDVKTVEKFMAEKKFSLPVLLDDGFVHRAGIDVFPTTWFLDRQGRIAFNVTGWSEKLVDEYAWRIEALR
jgi:thiol-disulfide isomerase/thioredoxin